MCPRAVAAEKKSSWVIGALSLRLGVKGRAPVLRGAAVPWPRGGEGRLMILAHSPARTSPPTALRKSPAPRPREARAPPHRGVALRPGVAGRSSAMVRRLRVASVLIFPLFVTAITVAAVGGATVVGVGNGGVALGAYVGWLTVVYVAVAMLERWFPYRAEWNRDAG